MHGAQQGGGGGGGGEGMECLNPNLGCSLCFVARRYWCQTGSGDELLQRTVQGDVLSKCGYCRLR